MKRTIISTKETSFHGIPQYNIAVTYALLYTERESTNFRITIIMAAQKAFKIECTNEGEHDEHDRETIMEAIEYTLTHNQGQTDGEKIRARLVLSLSTIIIFTGSNARNNVAFEICTCKYSFWKVNGTEYQIYTDFNIY